jgi:outer membrane protein assembly factor BamB
MLTGIVGCLLLGLTTAPSTDWTQWRGPNRDAISPSSPSPAPWPAELTHRWRAAVGIGQSSPVVSGNTVFLFGREGEEETARALDLQTGRTLWRTGYPAPYRVYPGAVSYGSGPKSTPVLHEGRLFTLGISGILTSFEAKDGRIAWQQTFAGRFKATAPPFGTSMSPLVVNGRLIVHAGGHEGGALIAFDPATGAEKWTLDGDGPSYSSPIVTSLDGQPHLVIQVHRKILGVDPTSGKALWSVPFVTPCDQNIVTPLRAGNLIVVSSQDTGTRAIEVTRQGTGWVPRTAWQTQDVSMYMSSPVFVNGKVIGLSHRKKGQFFALDPLTGSIEWTSEPGQGENAALVLAQGALLVLQESGTLLVLPQDGAGFSPTRRYQVADGGTYAYPVPTPLGILIRDENGISLYAAREPARRASAQK